MFRKDFVAIALLLSAAQVSADPLIATQYGDFDRYVLALSWQNGVLPKYARPQPQRTGRVPPAAGTQQ
ncbi:ribonuclease I [Klebsiella michiganensis]|uniref:Ribonuclease I n=1 Tax=Klebsiella michiganensis TaxID=1134687 RepID=A0A7H4N4T5_9ENTR|nr:ribonuclease I [Klebsiella michiganensis]